MMRFHPVKLGLTAGIFWGATVCLGTLWLLMIGSGGSTWYLISNFYPGFQFSVLGAFVGLVYGFVDGFICAWLFAQVYNAFLGKARTGAAGQ